MLKGRLPLSPAVVVKGLGSGVIIDRDGYIVTNYHVVQDASELAVALADGTLHLTCIVGVDTESDIALLKIDAEGLRPIALTDINEVSVGDVALAVGNPLGVGQTVTQGIISAIVRKGATPVENFIQTDAAINPGNSGGALIDTAGRLVGINVAILSRSGGSEGIGFAIPVDYVQTVASALRTKGRVARAWLGVSTAPPQHGDGALVVLVEPGRAGRSRRDRTRRRHRSVRRKACCMPRTSGAWLSVPSRARTCQSNSLERARARPWTSNSCQSRRSRPLDSAWSSGSQRQWGSTKSRRNADLSTTTSRVRTASLSLLAYRGGSMNSKVIVITGASGRVGAAAARRLASDGHRVVLVGRPADKTAALAQELATEYFLADFTRLSDVRTLADRLLAKYPRIDVLAHNAGCVCGPERRLSPDGHEMTFQVNYLAGFAHHAAHRSSDQVARDGDLQFRLCQQVRDHRPPRP